MISPSLIVSNSIEVKTALFWVITQKKGKGKTILVQAWTGPEDSRRLRLPDFKKIGT